MHSLFHDCCRVGLAIFLLGMSWAAPARGQDSAAEQARMLSPFLGRQCIAVVRLRVADLPIDTALGKLREFFPAEEADFEEASAEFHGLRQALLAAGAHEVYFVVTKHALNRDQPGYLMVPKTANTDAQAIAKLIVAARLLPKIEKIVEHEQVVLLGDAMQVDGARNPNPPPPDALAAALAAVANYPIQLVVVPSADDRRVVEELLPRLPPELGGGPSTALTRGMLWLAVGVGGGDGLELQLVVQSQDPAAAQGMLEIWKAGFASLARMDMVREAAPNLAEAAGVLTPAVEGDRLSLKLHRANNSMPALLAALKPPLAEMRRAAHRSLSTNHLKQIALAMHNFHDIHKRFPAIGTFDASGKGLLSWRVHLLPYLDEEDLYQQFRLDESWDSPHNKALIGKMPNVFACPQSKHAVTEGLSTYRLVVGEGTAFPGREGIGIRGITDGSVNTIMALEVDDDHAVIWSKPEGLPLNRDNPLEGIGGQFPSGFHAATCDGAVHFIPQTVEKETMLRLLLRNDGNPVAWP